MAVESKTKGSPHRWWFDSYNHKDTASPRRSPWLQSTLSELDEKTKAMLNIIEQDADSFAQRAEMYYKKRPELISMVEDFYRAQRSLAERYDQVKSDAGFRLISPWKSPSPLSSKFRKEKMSVMTCTEISYDSYSETYDPVESEESEVDDPEPEEGEGEKEEEEEEEVSSEFVSGEVMKLREEIERLKEENKIQKEEIAEKDEEKREVIRQLSLVMDVLREENVKLKKCIARESPKKCSPHSDFQKFTGMFMGKLFNGSPK
ncbi:hypothetical protein RHGRI_035669 [Rhododendron griersonianum]|uniref:NAB domain-containing protein n=1 Tax=Rhododendron griersonianum TaxID=479676 RepID=A0AAV6HKR0_9ERIC|nr:hypothetical protein RHGRI_035669 [Rhododendron griersonianum]